MIVHILWREISFFDKYTPTVPQVVGLFTDEKLLNKRREELHNMQRQATISAAKRRLGIDAITYHVRSMKITEADDD